MEKGKKQNDYSSHSGTETSQSKPSMMIALAKLREIEDRIQTTKNKLYVMQARNQKDYQKDKEQKRLSLTRSMVEKDRQEFRRRKKSFQIQVKDQVEEYKRKNNKMRKQIKKNIRNARETCRQNKSLMYNVSKKEQYENEKSIFENKNRDASDKKKKHEIVMDNIIKGRKNIEKYMQIKMRHNKAEKQTQTKKLLYNIEEKQRVLSKLERYGSSEMLEESRGSDLKESEDLQKSKNFRVKVISKGTTTIIPA